MVEVYGAMTELRGESRMSIDKSRSSTDHAKVYDGDFKTLYDVRVVPEKNKK